MQYFIDLITNRMLVSAFLAWGIAQVIKFIINALLVRKWDIKRLFGDGGMPSGHSATVLALTTASAILYSLASYQFAISAVLAIIVTHDATGVRRESGKHAKALNELMEQLSDYDISDEEKLKEFLGHTHLQVLVGSIIGIIVAVIVCRF